MQALLYEDEVAEGWRTEIQRADRVSIAAAMLTCDGLQVISSVLKEHLKQKRVCEFLVGVDMATEPYALSDLLEWKTRDPSLLEVRCFRSSSRRIFHPKFGVFYRGAKPVRAILGSSNLTWGGLKVNCEANVLIDDETTAAALAEYFEELWIGAYATPLDQQWLDKYRALWDERQAIEKKTEDVRERVVKITASSGTSSQIPPRIKNHRFAFTGRVTDWPREKKLYPEVEKLGGAVVRDAKGIASAHCLVHGDILGEPRTTQKLRGARENGIPVITVETFFEIRNRELAHRRRPTAKK